MKILILACNVLLICSTAKAQPGANFYPHHRGDVWQYRSAFTGDVVRTDHIDSTRVDTLAHLHHMFFTISSFGSSYQTRYQIDQQGNLYNLDFLSEYPRYELNADSGASWFAGYDPADRNRFYRTSVIRAYQRTVFGVPTIAKVFRFEMRYVRSLGDTVTFSLGNDHLASELGLVQIDVEPSDVYVLTGAIVDSVHYGTILNTREGKVIPSGYYLSQNYPNPFTPITTVVYDIPTISHVKLEVFDVLGQLTTTLVDQTQAVGTVLVQRKQFSIRTTRCACIRLHRSVHVSSSSTHLGPNARTGCYKRGERSCLSSYQNPKSDMEFMGTVRNATG